MFDQWGGDVVAAFLRDVDDGVRRSRTCHMPCQEVGGTVSTTAPANPTPHAEDEEVWRRQSVWSQTANRLKTQVSRARAAALTLTIAAAVLALRRARSVPTQRQTRTLR